MQGYLDKSLYSIPEVDEPEFLSSTGAIYLSQSPLDTPKTSYIYVVHSKESYSVTARLFTRNGKTYVKIGSHMIPFDWKHSIQDANKSEIHLFPHGPITQLSSRPKDVLV